MTADPHSLLSALLDREAVDPDALQQLLETPEARALLVDFVRLRSLAREEAFAVPVTVPPPRWRRHLSHPAALRGAAAVILFVTGLAGGAWWADQRGDNPPAPHRIVRFQTDSEWRPIPGQQP
jgi:hypothetical protein